MMEKQFSYENKDGWGGMWSQLIAWVNFFCPSCKQYHSNNFLFQLKPDQTEYISDCKICREEMKILIPKELNNRLYELEQKHLEELDDKCERHGSKTLDKWGISL